MIPVMAGHTPIFISSGSALSGGALGMIFGIPILVATGGIGIYQSLRLINRQLNKVEEWERYVQNNSRKTWYDHSRDYDQSRDYDRSRDLFYYDPDGCRYD